MGDYTNGQFLYKPALGAYGTIEKASFDAGFDIVDARLGKEVWIGDPGAGYNTFVNAVGKLNAAGSGVTLVVPAGTHTLTSNLTVNSNVNLVLLKGAIINVGTFTLTINGTIQAGPYQIFNWSGSGKVQFGSGASPEYLLRWWGARGDGVTDDTAAIQKAIEAFGNNSGAGTLVGCAYDIYRVTSLDYFGGPDGEHRGRVFVFDGRGAAMRQLGTGTSPMLKFYQGGRQWVVCNWSFNGSLKYIFYKGGFTGKPTKVEFNNVMGTQQSSLANLDADKEWYYDNINGILFIYLTVTDSQYPEDIYSNPGVEADDVAITGWERYLPADGLHLNNSTDVTVRNCWFTDFNRALFLDGTQFSSFENITITRCNYGIASRFSASNCIGNRFTGFHMVNIYQDAIDWQSGSRNLFESFSTEAIRNRVAYIKAGSNAIEAISLRNIRLEGISCMRGSAVPEAFYFENIEGLSIRDSLLNGGGTIYASSMQQLLYLKNCKGVDISGNKLFVRDSTGTSGALYDGKTKKCYLYKAEGLENGGITFRNNKYDVFRCTNTEPVANFIDNYYEINDAIQMPVGVVRRSGLAHPEWCKNHSFWQPLASVPTASNASWVIDTATGVDDSRCLKITWAGSSASVQLNNFLSSPSVPVGAQYVPVLSFFYKSDTAQTLTVSTNNGPGAGYGILTQDDEQWRVAYIVGNEITAGTSVAYLKFGSDASAGNVWIDGVSLKFFRTKNEGDCWVGMSDLPARAGSNILPTGAAPSVKTLQSQSAEIWKTSNIANTQILNLVDGYEGQQAIIQLNDVYSTLKQFGTTVAALFSKVYTYNPGNGYIDVTLSSSFNYFRDTDAQVDDCIYFMSPQRYCSAIISVNSTDGCNHTYKWQYYSLNGWTDIPVSDSNALSSIGTPHTVKFNPPLDWQQYSVNNQFGYWIRIILTGVNTSGGAQKGGAIACGWMRLNGDFGPITNVANQCSINLVNQSGIWRELSRNYY